MGVAPPPVSTSEKNEALKLMKRSGIPFELAVMVARGAVSLNDVLKEMLARERRETLVREGMHPTLAGQVARGRMLMEKAQVIQRLWEAQKAPFSSTRFGDFANGPMVAVSMFGTGMIGGRMKNVGRYDFRIVPEGTGEPVDLKKHDVKFFCRATDAADVLKCIRVETKVATLELGSTAELDERFRPTEGLAVDWVENRRAMVFVMRDGESLAGVPVRVSRYEIDLRLDSGPVATVMTHALFKAQPYRRSDGND